jgi:hypothetical protein
MPAHHQLDALIAAERKAEALLADIEAQGLVRPGRTASEVDQDIYALAEQSLACASTGTSGSFAPVRTPCASFAENPPVRLITEDDTGMP